MVPLSNYLILLLCINVAMLQDNEADRLEAELQLDDFELIDSCELLASAKKDAFLNQNYQKKIEQEKLYGAELKNHYNVLRLFTQVPTEFERNWTYQVKPGDSLLPEDKWNKMVLYENHIEELIEQTKLTIENKTISGKYNYYEILNNKRNLDVRQNTWITWQNIYNESDIEEYKEQLNLVKDAASLNEFDRVQEYWEALIDFEGAYDRADSFWEEIGPFYKKLQKFVKKRLDKYYEIQNSSEEIPVYLLGDELGTDWSNIADIILPHPQLHYDIESYLKYKDVKSIYALSENVTKILGLGDLGKNFWQKSIFNASACGPQMFEFCYSDYTEIIECNRPSWPLYLNSHKTAIKVALNNIDYSSLPRQRLRYCAIDDAVETLGSLLAIESLDYHGIAKINTSAEGDDPIKMTKLLLVALRIMPKLAYSLMVDKWRLNVLEDFATANLSETWWKYRKDYMGVEGITNKEPEYLEDARIISNKPYINKFFGTLMAFQIMSFYTDRSDSIEHIIKEFGQDETFISLLKSRHTLDWPYLFSIHYGFDLNTEEILRYFEPLITYFDSAPLEQVPLVTTTTTTTTTTTSTTTKRPIVKAIVNVVNDQPNLNLNKSLSKADLSNEEVTDNHVAMYVGVGLAVALGCVLIIVFVQKKILRRKPRTNNRRFDT